MKGLKEIEAMSIHTPQLLVGVIAGTNSIHTIIIRQEAEGRLRLMGEHRNRKVMQNLDEDLLIQRIKGSIELAIKEAEVDLDDILTIGVATPGQIDITHGT